ncbi:protein aurora borealis [Oryzias melastigma]|uniref:Protein aurora borealis n=1 Tax=Oryzias melastigma TaxID=30732 RepID=A0A3B3DCE8_ORYME|nr:protein aurora borealis [Oryzias melastigma]XP_024153580.1 protein aurora borealis [Oryzias melastigma]XP_024153581.1 protein aurora borealis [Oryzias melastigma]XP_024153582.1 protein aurora borealis [Oryzias melastigma]
MGDHIEVQITPETPGRPSIRNPFESPNDYHHLREPLVPSPSVFKSKSCKATPPKFNWSIDEMASLLPVHIDPEEIQRQSFYLSQTRTDSDVEEKFQSAIEQFFTKGAIVPSPWAASETRRAPHIYKKSPLSETAAEPTEKISVGCQTVLSLPLTFDLEKLLGEYYRNEDACDAVQESLSSSSLRRKLFLDGQFSYSSSDSSAPPSPERAHVRAERPSTKKEGRGPRTTSSEGDKTSPVFTSPLSCGISAPTPSTGQFSSSPIRHGCVRDCSLGSIGSPLLPDRSSPAGHASPTISPILADVAHTPISSAERKQRSNVTPLCIPLDVDVSSCNESPFVEGCSPIRSCSPHQLQHHKEHPRASRTKPRVRVWTSPPLICQILNPKLQDGHEAEEHHLSASPSAFFSSMEFDPSSPQRQDRIVDGDRVHVDAVENTRMEEDKETGMERGMEEEEDEPPSGQLTSSRMGNVSGTESSPMFLSLLAEGSSIRCDSSMQVDSGYNTTSAGTASLIDGLGSDFQGKESLNSNMVEEAIPIIRQAKIKALYSHH